MFTKGNQAGGIRRKEAMAKIIAQRIEKDGDNLTSSQFTALVNKFGALTAKRRRRRPKAPDKAETRVMRSFADLLTGEEAEIHREVLRIEAERLEARREEYRKRTGTTA